MYIDKLQKRVNGKLVDMAPFSIFDAIQVSETDPTTLTQVYNAFTKLHDMIICIMPWDDDNPANESRLGRFVTLVPNKGTVAIATPNDRIFGVTVPNDSLNTKKQITVCIYGAVTLECATKVFASNMNGKSISISDSGRGIIANSKRWYDVITFIDETHVEIFYKPQVDTINRIASLIDDINDRFPADLRFDIVDDEVIMTHK